jgi:GlcNAc-P-P-Und epimerase
LKCAVIFGGMGFIGAFFAKHLVESQGFTKVYLFDLELVSSIGSNYRKSMLSSMDCLEYIHGDVRQPINWIPRETVGLIANFSAVHREPGHKNYEYYETNLMGAENVCRWAEKVKCDRVIFSSSIAPYGLSDDVLDEFSLPVPTTAYGGSKLVAEKIHQIWQAADIAHRHLVIVRPGVVFGPGEGGNVSRLIRSVNRRYFFYMGNRNTRKAGVYVKELCNAITWVLDTQSDKKGGVILFNMSMNPGPSIQEYVEAIFKVIDKRFWIPSLPYRLLLFVSYVISACADILRLKHPFDPIRIKKLVRSNHILPNYLVSSGYKFIYTLEEAFEDWKYECPNEWN